MSIPFVKEIKNIVKLSFPIAISAITISMMGIVDTMMVGNYNTEQLAYVGLATAVFVLYSHVFAARRANPRITRVWR